MHWGALDHAEQLSRSCAACTVLVVICNVVTLQCVNLEAEPAGCLQGALEMCTVACGTACTLWQ